MILKKPYYLEGPVGSVGSLKYRPEITQREDILSTVALWQERRLVVEAAVVITHVVEATRLARHWGADSGLREGSS